MRQNLSQQPRTEMPHVARPHSFDREPLRQLSDDGFNPMEQVRQAERKWLRLSFSRAKRNNQAQAVGATFGKELRRPVVSITERKTFNIFKQVFGDFQLVPVGGRKLERCNDTRQRDSQMKPHAEESLPRHFVEPISRDFAQPTTPISASKAAHLNWKRINQRHARVKERLWQAILPAIDVL